MKVLQRVSLCGFLFLASIASEVSFAQQSAQINYQGVARKADGSPIVDQAINLRLSIRDGGLTSPVVYSETRALTTNKFGLFTTVIGSQGAGSQTGSMNAVVWATGNKYLQVELDPDGGNNFQNLGTSQLQSVPYAVYASQALPAGNAGGDLAGAYPNPAVRGIQGFPVSAVAPQSGQVLKWSGNSWAPGDANAAPGQASTITASVPLSVITTGATTTLALNKANANTDGYLSRADWLLFSDKISKESLDNAVGGLSAAITAETSRATNAEALNSAVTDSKIASAISAVKVGLENVNNTSDAAKPVSTATQTALEARELLVNKSTNVITDGVSDTKYPSVKSVKTYVDAAISNATTPDADATNKGKIQLAGDLTGTASVPLIRDGAITDVKIAAGAAISDSKLATISTAGKITNTATSATSDNTAGAIVARDVSGNFTAGTVTANLTGTASIATNIAGGTVGVIAYQSAANTTALLAAGTAGYVLQSNGAAAPTWVPAAGAVREVADEASATASQTSFTLSQTPSANSKVKMFVNGIRISNNAYSFTGSTLTYVPGNNGGYSFLAGDRIQFDYYY